MRAKCLQGVSCGSHVNIETISVFMPVMASGVDFQIECSINNDASKGYNYAFSLFQTGSVIASLQSFLITT